MNEDKEDAIIRGIITATNQSYPGGWTRTARTFLKTILLIVLGLIVCGLIFGLVMLLGAKFLPGVGMVWLP